MLLLNYRRFAVALLLLGAVILPLYVFLLREEARIEEGFSNAVLVDTPPVAGQQKVGVRAGELAPNFEVSLVDGSRVRLSDLRGQPVLISFFALWCGSCLSEMPLIQEVQEERGIDRLTVLAINTGETRSRALEFIDFIQAPFTWGLDFDLTVADAYGVRGLPYTVYVDAQGVVRAVYAGAAERERLDAYVDAAFKGSEPPVLANRLRIISTIPRDRVLLAEIKSAGDIVFTSRALRCDAGYCAEPAIDGVRQLNGVLALSLEANSGQEPRLSVRYDPALITEDRIVQRLADALRALNDPVYESELEIRYSARP